MGQRMLVAFIPPEEVVRNMEKVRELAEGKIQAGANLEAPHITLIDNSYADVEKVDKVLRKIAKSTKPFVAEIKGLDTFNVNRKLKIEKYVQHDSLIYMIKKNTAMSRFRKEILGKLKPWQTDERAAQWIAENPKLSKGALNNILRFGTPFGLKEWKFHATIGLIPKLHQKDILKKIQKLNYTKDWNLNRFALFVREDGWKLVSEYSLEG